MKPHKATRNTACSPLKWSEAMKLLSILREEAEGSAVAARYRLLLAVGFYTGLRISDILKLTWLVVTQEVWTLQEKKTKKLRTIEVNPKLRRIINQTISYCDVEDYEAYIFVGSRGPVKEKRPLSIIAVNNMIKAIFDRYDIVTDNASSHTLRKTFGRRVYEYNQRSEDALILLSKIFNHRDLQVTREYIGLTGERIRSAYTNI